MMGKLNIDWPVLEFLFLNKKKSLPWNIDEGSTAQPVPKEVSEVRSIDNYF